MDAAGSKVVSIAWISGKVDRDLSPLVAELAALDDEAVFNAVIVGEDGWSLVWPSGAGLGLSATKCF